MNARSHFGLLAAIVVSSIMVQPLCGHAGESPDGRAGSGRIYQVAEVYRLEEKPVDQVITIEGFPASVCVKCGKKAVMRDRDPEAEYTLRVERTGEMKPFLAEHVGRTMQVTGVLREKRMDAAYFDEWEARVKADNPCDSADGAGCATKCPEKVSADKTLARIAGLREKLASAPSGYLAVLWLDGLNFEVVETTAAR